MPPPTLLALLLLIVPPVMVNAPGYMAFHSSKLLSPPKEVYKS